MKKIKVLFIQEKQIKNRAKVLTLGDLIEKEVPDTYEIDYVSIKENVIEKIDSYRPQIIFASQSKAFDILELVQKIRKLFPMTIILVNLSNLVSEEQEMACRLKEAGAYKCYSSTLSLDTLIHDMFVALNME